MCLGLPNLEIIFILQRLKFLQDALITNYGHASYKSVDSILCRNQEKAWKASCWLVYRIWQFAMKLILKYCFPLELVWLCACDNSLKLSQVKVQRYIHFSPTLPHPIYVMIKQQHWFCMTMFTLTQMNCITQKSNWTAVREWHSLLAEQFPAIPNAKACCTFDLFHIM